MAQAEEVRKVRGLLRALDRREIDRREFLKLAGVFSAGAIVAACTPAATGDKTPAATGRKVVPLGTTETDPTNLAFYAAAIREFSKQSPEVDVPLNLYSESTSVQFLTTAFRNNHDVGVFSPIASYVNTWASSGYLLPVDEVVAAIGADDFYPGTRVVLNKHDYQISFQSNVNALWYRKDLFEKAGLPAPTTYARLLGAAKELNGKDGIVGIATGIGGPTTQFTLSCATPYILQSGWGYFAKDGKLTFDRPEVLEGVKRFVEVLKNTNQSFYNADFPDLLSGYISGRAAMAHYPGRLGFNLDRQAPKIADVTAVVGEPGGPFMEGRINNGSTRGYAIYAKTAAPAEALAFLKFLTTGTNALTWALTIPGQVMPALKSVAAKLQDQNEPLVKANAYMKTRSEWMKGLQTMLPAANEQTGMGSVQNMQFAPISNPNPWADKIWTQPSLDGAMFQQIMLQKKDPELAWRETSAQMDKIAKDWLAQNPGWKPAE